MNKKLFVTGCVFALIAVILGALGAHALKEKLSPEQLSSFETGVRYQFYHALALIIVALHYERFKWEYVTWAGRFFIYGICFFSGSIYLLSVKDILNIELLGKISGPITPFGGILMIAGWIFLILSIIKNK
ncbi:MAG: DUF423 domain-containing protein [Bacteroidota bacterium]